MICAAVLLVGYIAGRVTGSGSGRTVTVAETVERSVVVRAQNVGSARDGRDSGPLDLARVQSVRRGVVLQTTIAAWRPWRDSLLRRGTLVRGHATLSLLYDTNYDGKTDHRDAVFPFGGALTSWISDLGQGVQAADVTRRSPTTISVARDVVVFYNRAGEAGLVSTSPIGVAVVARWKGGSDRVPDRGWITAPPPAAAAAPAPASSVAAAPAVSPSAAPATTAPCVERPKRPALARLNLDLAALRRAAARPTRDTLKGNAAINRATDTFLHDLETAPLDNLVRNRLIDHAAAIVVASCQQCFQALEAERPIPSIAHGGACSG